MLNEQEFLVELFNELNSYDLTKGWHITHKINDRIILIRRMKDLYRYKPFEFQRLRYYPDRQSFKKGFSQYIVLPSDFCKKYDIQPKDLLVLREDEIEKTLLIRKKT